MKTILYALVFLLISVSTATAETWAVAPGQGVGPVKLGQSPEQINSHMPGTSVLGSKRNLRFVRYGKHALVEYSAMKAVMITLNKPVIKSAAGSIRWTPPSGAGIGVPWSVAESKLGRNYTARTLKTAKGHPKEVYYAFTRKGLGFRTKGGRIVQVDIWQAK